MAREVFRSKVDAWLVGLIGLGLAAAVVAMVVGTAAAGAGELGLALGLTLAVTGFVAWLFATTRYELDGRELVARAGPFRWRVDLATVQSVTPSRNPLSSPALSLDRLEVRHGDGRCLLVSPADRDRFLAALARAEPALERHGDALRRRA